MPPTAPGIVSHVTPAGRAAAPEPGSTPGNRAPGSRSGIASQAGRCLMKSPAGRPTTSGSTPCSRRSPTSAPPPAGRASRCARHAGTWPGTPAAQHHNHHFGTQPKRSPDDTAADHNGGSTRDPIGIYVTSVTASDRLRQMGGPLQATQATRVAQRAPRRPPSNCYPAELAGCSAPHRRTRPRILHSDGLRRGNPASLSLDCLFFTRMSKRKIVELRGFEPLTSCMPCLAVSSGGVALSRIIAGQRNTGV
jgi:hypothetical protein